MPDIVRAFFIDTRKNPRRMYEAVHLLMGNNMELLFIALAGAVLALLVGYFLNIYVVLVLLTTLVVYVAGEVRRPNPMHGTSGHMGGMFIGFVFLVPFVAVTVITTLIVNYEQLATLAGTIAQYAKQLLLR